MDAAVDAGDRHFIARMREVAERSRGRADVDLRLTSRCGGVLARFRDLPGNVDGTPIGTYVDPPDRETVLAAHRAALQGRSGSYETRFQGRIFSARVEPLVDASGEIIGVVGFAFDVTDWRRTENRLRTIIESEPECVKIVDQEGRLLRRQQRAKTE